MKNIFSKQNISTTVVCIVAVTIAVIVVIPLVRKFVPDLKKTTTTAPAA